ncbi:transposable element Tc1 transposase [Trichonephila clavipes]|nr:transposable element Tc1 transposase [Trichonephila clavipes]
MPEGTTDRRGRSHPPQCTTSREDRQIVRMAVTGRSVTSRTVAQHIESVTHHSVSVRTIRRRFTAECSVRKTSIAWSTLDAEPQMSPRQWCDERRMRVAEWNEIVFTDESRICLQHHDGRIRVWRHHGERMLNSCVMHCHTGPAPGIMVWGGIGYHSRTPLVRIVSTLNSQLYIFEIELLPWPVRSPDLSPIENMWSTVDQRLPHITSPAATDQLWLRVEAARSAVPQEHIQSLFESMPRRVAAVISNNGGYSGY